MKNIVLIGFMGAGKTTVGIRLADRLELSFIDVDQKIEESYQTSISDIFEKKGEPYFRQLEKEAIEKVAATPGKIISCGGGAVMDPDNVRTLKKEGVLVYLRAPIGVLFERTRASSERPLLEVPDAERKAKELFGKRKETYESVSDITIDTEEVAIDQVVDAILDKLGE